MPNRSVHLVILFGLAAIAVATVVMSPPYERRQDAFHQRPLLAYVPAGAELVLTVHVTRLRQTTLGRLLAARGRELPQVGTLEQVCGFDPTDRIDRVIMAVPTTGPATERDIEVGFVVLGDFSAERLARCAGAVVSRRGGEPAASPIGTFITVRNRLDAARGEVAVRDGGPAILGGGTYLRDLVDVAEGRGPSAYDSGLHTALREAVNPDGDAVIVASWVPGPGACNRFVHQSASVPASLRGMALRVAVSPDLEMTVLFDCKRVGCEQVAASLRELRDQLTATAHDLLGLDLGRLEIAEKPDQVELSLRLAPAEAGSLVDRLLDVKTLLRASPE